jgi:phage tail sheath gpL-like
MAISFNQIPSSARTPAVFVEFDATRAQQSPSARRFHAAIIGQRLTSVGTVLELVPTQFTRDEQVAAAFGFGSQIHMMARAFFAQTPNADATFIAIDDPSGDAAEGTVTFAVSSPTAGTIAVYVAGRRYTITSATTSTAATLATALAAAINADALKAVTAAAVSDVVTLTARHVGVAAGAFDVRHSHAVDESLPAGVTCTIVAMADGTGDVVLADALAVLPADEQFHVFAQPYIDSTSLTALETELADRFGPERMIGGIAFAATNGNLSTATSLGNSRNSPHSSISSIYGSPTPIWEVAAAIAGQAAKSAAIDPALPLQTLELVGVMAPKASLRFSREERDSLLHDGIATTRATVSGGLMIDRQITTYQLSPAGAADIAYLDVTTPFTLDLLRYELRTLFATRYARYKLANDGNRIGAGQKVMTPKLARAELLALARSWETRGLIENLDDFKELLVVERNESDANRLDMYIPPDLVNGLVVIAAQIGFRI